MCEIFSYKSQLPFPFPISETHKSQLSLSSTNVQSRFGIILFCQYNVTKVSIKYLKTIRHTQTNYSIHKDISIVYSKDILIYKYEMTLKTVSGADPGFVVRGGVSRRGVRSPAGPGQNSGRGPGAGGQSPPEALRILRITDIYLNDNFEPTTPFLSTGARCVRKKKLKKILYNTTRGRTHLLPFF